MSVISMTALPVDLTLKVMVEISPLAVFNPGFGMVPWKLTVPTEFENEGWPTQSSITDLPAEGETIWSLSGGKVNPASIALIELPAVLT